MSEQIERIMRMEEIYDRGTEAVNALLEAMRQYKAIAPELQELEGYYTSPLWIRDFFDDRDGKIPQELNRGILTEDAIWDLLTDQGRLQHDLRALVQPCLLYTPLTKKALKLCFDAHRDQTDKSGMPYVFHPFHLAGQMLDEDTTVVALLHDVVEDSSYTLEDLRRLGFPEQVLEAIALMTHDPAEPYLSYVARIRDNPIARTVKLADLRHNSDVSRLDTVDDRARERLARYQKAIAILEG